MFVFSEWRIPSGDLEIYWVKKEKKSKLTILEKSKQDWDGYKKKEGIVEELVTYNKGKDGLVFKFFIHCMNVDIYCLMGNIFILVT